ncbi:MAG: hypothetical protein ABWJ97_01550 [Thermoproteus sp.]
MAVRAEGSKKVDCLILKVDYSKERPGEWTNAALRYARIRSRKLVLAAFNGVADMVLADLRALSANNIDFPVRLYEGQDLEEIIRAEGCGTYEIKTVDDMVNLTQRVHVGDEKALGA